jgi:hypothetical protein
MIRTLSLIIASISFIIVIGGGTYEHLAMVPVWSSAAPASLTMFQGPYAIAAQNFWIPIHPVTISLLTVALLLNWKTDRRNYIAVTLTGYLLVLAITAVYFVPELMSITQTTFSTAIDFELTRRANLWETLSLVRLVFLIGLAITILFGLSKTQESSSQA